MRCQIGIVWEGRHREEVKCDCTKGDPCPERVAANLTGSSSSQHNRWRGWYARRVCLGEGKVPQAVAGRSVIITQN